ncbi:hypothetical protein BGZ61DRAFT_468144 [Ilyonectria robusta]|uniref:uncharacterized protein n=1 Tax=Ilyonectria robusta TaxID=1079257 RepID=UPI001E8DBBF0|nr:uncharacterized protein BGZ61DRAFT_468144 [Ilyonectria robusta]KAH8653296.1 hypothetical protein BGZ61DRAFT_468144 [Ilyonectria robusta]
MEIHFETDTGSVYPVGEPSTSARKMTSTACEACRAAKIKCRPSEQPGVCRKCLESKRECISRTGPRTRRRRTKFLGGAEQPRPPPASRASKTFTIDFDVPSLPEVDENFDALRDTHEQFIENLFPSEPDSDFNDLHSSPMTCFRTPLSSHSHSIQSLHAKPQFNLESADDLLKSFRVMLPYFPCIDLKPEVTVLSLAASRPFVLLAILAAASGSRTLQGHNLYDEEFRKVLGLKVVAGGERSIELLQGMLIYCAWYPFHLRPKNRQAFRYVRMAGDMVRDMELDQELPELNGGFDSEVTKEQLEKVRAYLSWFYVVSNFISAWRKMDVMAPFTAWTAICCDILQRCAAADGDFALSYLVRFASYTNAAKSAIHESTAPSEQQSQLVLFGLEAQSRELRQCMLPHIARSVPVKFSELFFRIYLAGGPLLRLGQPKNRPSGYIPPSIPKLKCCVAEIRTMFDFVSDLGQSAFNALTCSDWLKFILTIIAALRLSFPLTELPGWDDAWARSELRFDEFLTHMCEGSDLITINTRVDVFSAGRVVLRVVKDKYDRRIALHTKVVEAAMEATAAMPSSSGIQGCPVFDHSVKAYIAAWDTGFDVGNVMPPPTRHAEGQQAVSHDWWATMTMGWAYNTTGNNE